MFHIFLTIGLQMVVRFSALHAGRVLTPERFMVAGIRKTEKKISDLIGNRNSDLPACSMAPQPTMLPKAKYCYGQLGER
jgi:hypothetical protein